MLDKDRLIKVNLMIRSSIKETKKLKTTFAHSVSDIIVSIAEEYECVDYDVVVDRISSFGYRISLIDGYGDSLINRTIHDGTINNHIDLPQERFRSYIRTIISELIGDIC